MEREQEKRKPEERKELPEILPEEEVILPEEENLSSDNLDIFATSSSSSDTSSSDTDNIPELPEYKIVIREKDFLLFEILTRKLLGNFPLELLPNNIHSPVVSIRIGTHTGKAIIFKSKKKEESKTYSLSKPQNLNKKQKGGKDMIGKYLQEMLKLLNFSYISSENVIFIGPPGTAKTMLITSWTRKLKKSLFHILMTKFTTVDEVFGPIDIEAYKRGIFRRITTGKLPEAEIAYLDEIFKSNSAILNSLLTIMNERIFFNPKPVPVKTEMIISSSNEIPDDDSLLALYDRFLFRYFTDYLSIEEIPALIDYANSDNIFDIQIPDYVKEKSKISKPNPLPSDINDMLIEIFNEISQTVTVSDRRKVKIVKALRVIHTVNELNPLNLRLVLKSTIPSTRKELNEVEKILDKFIPDIDKIVSNYKTKINQILNSDQNPHEKMESIKTLLSEIKNPGIRNIIKPIAEEAIMKLTQSILNDDTKPQ